MRPREFNDWIDTIQKVYQNWSYEALMEKPVSVVYNIYRYCKNLLSRNTKTVDCVVIERNLKKSDVFEYNEEDGCWYKDEELISDSDLKDYL